MRNTLFGTALASATLLSTAALGADGLRVAAWNITNYGGGNATHIGNVVYGEFNGNSMDPDVIMLQEIRNSGALSSLVAALNSATGSPGDWASATFYSGGGGGINTALVYRTSKLDLVGSQLVAPAGGTSSHPRNIVRYDLRLDGYLAEETTISLYPVHMKAGSGSSDQSRRLVESQKIRDNAETLPDGRHIVVGGDFNIQSSSQAAYLELVGSQANNSARFFDPITAPGSWNNSFTYRNIHTQDPSGAGGMDDRHDQILLTGNFGDGYGLDYNGSFRTPWNLNTPTDPNHSYRSWGNDGTTYNQAMRTTGNTMVGASIAQSIIVMAGNAGHCPVFLDLTIPAKAGATTSIDFGTVAQGEAVTADINVFNNANTALWTAAGIRDLTYELVTTGSVSAPSGIYTDSAGGGANAHTISLDTSTIGAVAGTLAIHSDDPDTPVLSVAISGEIVNPACNAADLAAPFGTLDLSDINALVAAFVALEPAADLAEPYGTFDLNDLNTFVAAFTAGCP